MCRVRQHGRGPLAFSNCDAMPRSGTPQLSSACRNPRRMIGMLGSPIQSRAQWTDILQALPRFGGKCSRGFNQDDLKLPEKREMQVFIRRFLMYYGVYRRY